MSYVAKIWIGEPGNWWLDGAEAIRWGYREFADFWRPGATEFECCVRGEFDHPRQSLFSDIVVALESPDDQTARRLHGPWFWVSTRSSANTGATTCVLERKPAA